MDNARLCELEEIYKLLYVNLYDDNPLHAELSLINSHADTEDKLETLIKEFIGQTVETICYTHQKIEEECGIDITTLRLINKKTGASKPATRY